MDNKCHGCKGNGWVSPNGMNAVLCPVCSGSGIKATYPNPYAPTQIMPLKITYDRSLVEEIVNEFEKNTRRKTVMLGLY